MNRINAFILAANVAVLPLAGVVQAQQNPDSARPRAAWGERGARPDMVARLLKLRAELKLTDAQVAQLTDVQKKFAERNQPIFDRLKASRGDLAGPRGREDRKAWAQAHPEAVKDFHQLRENGQAMRKEVLGVLTDEQKSQVKERMRREHGGKRGSGPRGEDSRTG